MSVDYELEPDIPWSKISSAIKAGKIRGITINLSKENTKKGMTVYILTKGKNQLFAYCFNRGTLFTEYGSRWSSTNPTMDAISKYFKVKYYADIDTEGWNAHVKRMNAIKSPQSARKTTTKINFI